MLSPGVVAAVNPSNMVWQANTSLYDEQLNAEKHERTSLYDNFMTSFRHSAGTR